MGWGIIFGASHLISHPPSQLISSVDPKFLNLTKVDDLIYQEFRETFRELRVDLLDPEELKSEPAKAVGERVLYFFLMVLISLRLPGSSLLQGHGD